jgi:hypothetical protein
MSSLATRLTKKLGAIGVGRVLGAGLEALRNKILHLIYGFDPWHVTGNFHARPYKADVVKLIESVPHDRVVEIGVGLGDILGRVRAEKRLGLDRDPQVLKAARFCVEGPVSFAVADFAAPDQIISALKQNDFSSVDVMILVNWIHMIEMDLIEQTILTVTKTIPLRYIVMDTIRPGTPGYRFTHTQDDLRRLGEIRTVIAADDVRDLIMIEMK